MAILTFDDPGTLRATGAFFYLERFLTLPDVGDRDIYLWSVSYTHYKGFATAGALHMLEAIYSGDVLWRAMSNANGNQGYVSTYPAQQTWANYGAIGSVLADVYAAWPIVLPSPVVPGGTVLHQLADGAGAGDYFERCVVLYDLVGAQTEQKKKQPQTPRPVPPYRCKLVAR